MEDFKPCETPYQLGVKLINECDSPKVNATLYRQLVDNLIYLIDNQPNICFVVSVDYLFVKDILIPNLWNIRFVFLYY